MEVTTEELRSPDSAVDIFESFQEQGFISVQLDMRENATLQVRIRELRHACGP